MWTFQACSSVRSPYLTTKKLKHAKQSSDISILGAEPLSHAPIVGAKTCHILKASSSLRKPEAAATYKGNKDTGVEIKGNLQLLYLHCL